MESENCYSKYSIVNLHGYVIARASRQRAPRNMELVGDDDLIALEDRLIQARELRVESSKREREVEKEEENTMTEIKN